MFDTLSTVLNLQHISRPLSVHALLQTASSISANVRMLHLIEIARCQLMSVRETATMTCRRTVSYRILSITNTSCSFCPPPHTVPVQNTPPLQLLLQLLSMFLLLVLLPLSVCLYCHPIFILSSSAVVFYFESLILFASAHTVPTSPPLPSHRPPLSLSSPVSRQLPSVSERASICARLLRPPGAIHCRWRTWLINECSRRDNNLLERINGCHMGQMLAAHATPHGHRYQRSYNYAADANCTACEKNSINKTVSLCL